MGGDDHPAHVGYDFLMRRLFYAGALSETIEITGGDAHHLAHVMRAQPGDTVVVTGTDGRSARMTVTAVSRETIALSLSAYLAQEEAEDVEVTLVQALLKGEKMDLVVQKAAELGAARLCPVLTEHVVVRYDEKKAAAKTARWQKIADEAAKQCGRSTLMPVASIASLTDFLQGTFHAGMPDTALIFCYEAEQAVSIRSILQHTAAQRVVLIVGAEGGFSPAEAAMIRTAGAQSVTLGRRILRAETAALAALAVTQYELGNLGV